MYQCEAPIFDYASMSGNHHFSAPLCEQIAGSTYWMSSSMNTRRCCDHLLHVSEIDDDDDDDDDDDNEKRVLAESMDGMSNRWSLL